MKIADLSRVLALPLDETEAVVREFAMELEDTERGIQLRSRAGAVHIEVKAAYVSLIGELFSERRAKPISDQADDGLAVIAHTQPISVQGVSDIRESTRRR